MFKSCFQRKEMPLIRGKVLTFHSWVNLAMEDIFLGCLFLVASVIPLSKLWSLERVHKPTGEWAEQNGRGERTKILRLPGGFPVRVFRILYGHSKGSNVWIQVCYICTMQLSKFRHHEQSIRQPVTEIFIYLFIYLFFYILGGVP